ncbi:MAG: hypothetical protein NTZ09_20205, partial [Candidatus Hydrogenedentes bacterium]|nr:hypothetical protein [Candidatus Hydrogenedentota bacterium]
MERGLIVGPDSRRKYRNIKVLTIFVMLAGLGLALWPAAALGGGGIGRHGERPNIGNNNPNPRMAARLREAQKQRNLNGPNMVALPPIRGSQPTLFILIEGSSSTLPFPWTGTPVARFDSRFRDPSHWVGLMDELDDYYKEVSRGIMRIVPGLETFGTINDGIIGPIAVRDMISTVTYNRALPLPYANSYVEELLAWEAIQAINPYVNFGIYDSNFDGILDTDELHLVFIQAGYEGSYYSSLTPFPRTWYTHWGYAPPFYVPLFDSDNIAITDYLYLGSMLNKPDGTSERIPVGPLANLMGLDIGLPLLDGRNMWAGLGYHCLMAYGGWGDEGKKPSHLCGYLKSYLFWGQETDVIVPTNQTFSLPASVGTNSLVRINVPGSAEFFIVENRQQYGFDEGLPGTQGGLAVYHCDDNRLYPSSFIYLTTINTNPYDAAIKLMQADGTDSLVSIPIVPPYYAPFSLGADTDYFRAGLNTTFNRLTNPNSLLKNGLVSNVEISNVSGSGPVMTFTLNHGNVFSFPANTLNVREEQGQAYVVVNLDRPAENTASVDYAAVAGGTATPYSAANQTDWDFHLPSGTLSFEPGVTSKYFSILLNNDSIVDPGETIELLLRNPKGAILNNVMSTMTLTILDNDKVWLNLISPNGGAADNKMRGSICPVRWNYLPAIGPEVRIDLFKDNAYYMTLPGAYHVVNDGYTTVTLPSTLPVSYKYRMAVTAVYDESYADQSDDYFAILDPNLHVDSVTINGGISPVTSRKVSLD